MHRRLRRRICVRVLAVGAPDTVRMGRSRRPADPAGMPAVPGGEDIFVRPGKDWRIPLAQAHRLAPGRRRARPRFPARGGVRRTRIQVRVMFSADARRGRFLLRDPGDALRRSSTVRMLPRGALPRRDRAVPELSLPDGLHGALRRIPSDVRHEHPERHDHHPHRGTGHRHHGCMQRHPAVRSYDPGRVLAGDGHPAPLPLAVHPLCVPGPRHHPRKRRPHHPDHRPVQGRVRGRAEQRLARRTRLRPGRACRRAFLPRRLPAAGN